MVLLGIYVSIALRPGSEFKHFEDNIDSRWYLPNKKSDIKCIQRDVKISGRLIPLLHWRNKGCCRRPQRRDSCLHKPEQKDQIRTRTLYRHKIYLLCYEFKTSSLDLRYRNAYSLPAPANRWGPGNSFPVLNHVLIAPPTDSNTPNPSSIEPALKCLSL